VLPPGFLKLEDEHGTPYYLNEADKVSLLDHHAGMLLHALGGQQ
jgi:hypothetical protein